jgi:hypothetical protein
MTDRYYPARVLRENEIPCLVWAEDALCKYGVPTVCFDLFLLTEDIALASKCLCENGYTSAPLNPRYQFIPELSNDVVRLWTIEENIQYQEKIAADDSIAVVLLPSYDWGFSKLTEIHTEQDNVPSLNTLYEGLVTRWLYASPLGLGVRLQTFLGYLYAHSKEVKELSFDQTLRPFFRDFHQVHQKRTIWLGEQLEWKKKKEAYDRV